MEEPSTFDPCKLIVKFKIVQLITKEKFALIERPDLDTLKIMEGMLFT